jgi:hypothetical protein
MCMWRSRKKSSPWTRRQGPSRPAPPPFFPASPPRSSSPSTGPLLFSPQGRGTSRLGAPRLLSSSSRSPAVSPLLPSNSLAPPRLPISSRSLAPPRLPISSRAASMIDRLTQNHARLKPNRASKRLDCVHQPTINHCSIRRFVGTSKAKLSCSWTWKEISEPYQSKQPT